MEKNQCLKTVKGHNQAVRSFCQVDDNHFASGSFDKTIKIWDINTLENVQTLEGHENTVICIIKLKDNRLTLCQLSFLRYFIFFFHLVLVMENKKN